MLPFELIVEILFRLPVKSLLRFRCVCMSWIALITDHQFAKKQLRTSLVDPTHLTRHHAMLYVQYESPLIDYPVPSLFNSSIASASQRMCTFVARSRHFSVESCHGILCLLTERGGVVLCNPFSGKFKTLPSLETQHYGNMRMRYGFGYDCFSDSYKVVALFSDGSHGFNVRVHTLGTDSWKAIQHLPASALSYMGRFVSGTLNWLGKDNASSSSVIVSLDLVTETYKKPIATQLSS